MTSNLLIEMGASRLATGDDRDAGVVLVRIPEQLYEKIHAAIARGEADAARLRGEMKAAFHELGGIGRESSKEFHRIGIDSARGILDRALTAK